MNTTSRNSSMGKWPVGSTRLIGLLLTYAYRSHADGLYGCGTILSGWMKRQFRALAGVFKTGRQAAAGVAAGAKGAVELFAACAPLAVAATVVEPRFDHR